MPEFVRVWGNNGIREVPVLQGVQEVLGSRVVSNNGGITNVFNCGLPFWLPPGDGGSNGLSFTGTRGVFTLSAEAPLAGCYTTLADGGYVYIPAGAGGLAGGWYWCKMTDGTNGEIYANTYTPSATVVPPIVSTPTNLANCTAGRITQSLSELTAFSWMQNGGLLGQNGCASAQFGILSNSSASYKIFKIKYATAVKVFHHFALSTTYNAQVVRISRMQLGSTNRNFGNRISPTQPFWDTGPSSATFSGNAISVDVAVDQDMVLTMQLSATTDSMLVCGFGYQTFFGG